MEGPIEPEEDPREEAAGDRHQPEAHPNQIIPWEDVGNDGAGFVVQDGEHARSGDERKEAHRPEPDAQRDIDNERKCGGKDAHI